MLNEYLESNDSWSILMSANAEPNNALKNIHTLKIFPLFFMTCTDSYVDDRRHEAVLIPT